LDISDMEGLSQLPGRFGQLDVLRDMPFRLACDPIPTSSRTLAGISTLAAVLADHAQAVLLAKSLREDVPNTWCRLAQLVLDRRQNGIVVMAWDAFEQLKLRAGFDADAKVNFRQVRGLSTTAEVGCCISF